MEALKSLFGQLIRSWFAYLIIVGKIGIQIVKLANNRTVMVGTIVQIESWLAELRQELLSSRKKPLTVIAKKVKVLGLQFQKELGKFETQFEDPQELVQIENQFETEFWDPRSQFETKSDARDFVESKFGFVPFTREQWIDICDSIAEDYPSLDAAAKAAKAKYPVTAHES